MFAEALTEATWDTLSARLNPLAPAAASKVALTLANWLALKANKAPVPDLGARLDAMNERIEKLARALVFNVDGDRVHVTARGGDNMDTLVLLDRGSTWFDGHPNVAFEIINAVLSTQ